MTTRSAEAEAAGRGTDAADGRAPSPGRAQCVLGIGLAAISVVWAVVAGTGEGRGRPLPMVLLVVAVVGVVAAARFIDRRATPVVPAVLAVGAAGALLVQGSLLRDTTGPPLGYANANAALAGLGCLAAIGAWSTRSPDDPSRWIWGLLATGLAGLTLIPTSKGAALALGLVVLLGGAALARNRPRAAVVGGAAAVVAVLSATVVLSLGADPAGLRSRSEARGDLWEAAIDMAGENPWRGVGPGMFEDHNPVSGDPNLRWAHHGYLQITAELGLPGAALLLVSLAWAYAALWAAARSRPAAAVVGAAALTLLALHATVDYVWHFPVLVLMTAALVGRALAGASPSSPPAYATPEA